MIERDDEADICRLDVARWRLFSIETLQTLLGGSLIGLFLDLVGLPASLSANALFPAIGATFLFGVVVAVFFIRKSGAIVVTEAGIALPRRLGKAGVTVLSLGQIRSVFITRNFLVRSLVIEAGGGAFGFPTARLPDPDSLPRLRAALTQALDAHPDGKTLRDAMALSQAEAERRAGVLPVVSWAATAIIVLVHVWLHFSGRISNPLALADLGAMAPSLVWQGEWYRLVTANLLEPSVWRLLGDGLGLVLFGGYVERLVGWRHLLILLAGSALAGQLATSVCPGFGHAVSSGPAPAVFGLIGATAVIGNRFARAASGEYRLLSSNIMRLGVCLSVAILVHLTGRDFIGNGTGFLAGLLGTALLCRGRAEPAALRDTHWLTNESLLAASAVFAISLWADAIQPTDEARRLADDRAIVAALAAHPETDSVETAAVASAVVNDRDAPETLRRAAFHLVSRSCAAGQTMSGGATAAGGATDALEDTDDDSNLPPDLTSALIWPPAPMPPYFGKLLERLGAQSSPTIFGGGVSAGAPALRLGGGVIAINATSTIDRGGRLYALVRDGQGAIAGMLFIMIPPGFSGSQILPIPTSRGAPSTTPPPPLWTDSTTRLQVAVFDRRPCSLRGEVMGPSFYPMPESSAP